MYCRTLPSPPLTTMLLRNLAPRSLSPRFLSLVSGNGFPARAPSPPPVAAAAAPVAEPAVAAPPTYPVCQDLATTVLDAAIRRRCNTWATCGNRPSHSHSSNGLFALLLYNGLLFLLPRVLARSHNDCPSRLV